MRINLVTRFIHNKYHLKLWSNRLIGILYFKQTNKNHRIYNSFENMGSNVEPELTLAPIRSLDEFILSSAHFQWPDKPKWNRIVANNLLYYQTNYFICAIVWFAFNGIINHPNIVSCLMAISVAILTKAYGNREIPLFYNLVPLMLIFIGFYLIQDSVAVLLLLVLIHASLRKRNFRNKISNTLEEIGVTKTPMGLLLDILRDGVTDPL